MEKKDVPQDESPLGRVTREVCYVKNEDGQYTTDLSLGWETKKAALDNAWEDINERIEVARKAVFNGEKSPVYYFMELKLMDLSLLSDYTGFWKFNIKRHFRPSIFQSLNEEKIKKYAKAFEITVDELKKFKG